MSSRLAEGAQRRHSRLAECVWLAGFSEVSIVLRSYPWQNLLCGLNATDRHWCDDTQSKKTVRFLRKVGWTRECGRASITEVKPQPVPDSGRGRVSCQAGEYACRTSLEPAVGAVPSGPCFKTGVPTVGTGTVHSLITSVDGLGTVLLTKVRRDCLACHNSARRTRRHWLHTL